MSRFLAAMIFLFMACEQVIDAGNRCDASVCESLGSCELGMRTGCRCSDGRLGARSCEIEHTFGACECDVCFRGFSPLACTCDDYSVGEQHCDSDLRSAYCICPSSKRVFVTNARYSGNLGGLSGADAKCLTAAQSVNLPGTWKAWLSTSTIHAIDRIADVGPWYLVGDPKKIFSNRANLSTLPLEPISFTERGTLGDTAENRVWTGTDVGGHSSHSDLCSDWTVASGLGLAGHSIVPGNNWTFYQTAPCSETLRLYCIQQ